VVTDKDKDDVDEEEMTRRKQEEDNYSNHGREVTIEETCRAAFSRDAENRSHMDLHSLKTWFQTTKLNVATDFHALEPLELTLLCRRMKLVTYYPHEVVFQEVRNICIYIYTRIGTQGGKS
jgi:hypothetical protein